MSRMNQVLAPVLAVVVAAALGLFIGLLWAEESIDLGSADSLRFVTAAEADGTPRVAATAAAGAGIVVLLALAVAPVLPGRTRMFELRAGRTETIFVSEDQLQQAIESDIRDIAEVHDVAAHVKERDARNLEVDLDLVLRMEASVEPVVAETNRVLARSVSDRYGASLARKPRIDVRFVDSDDEPKKGRARSATSAGAERS